jgi:dipeptidyl aminopeptidase/acylaminoacyl peptidase
VTPERWRRISDLYHQALAREPGEREVFVREATLDDEPLRREVVSLLAQPQSGGFLDGPAASPGRERPPVPLVEGQRLGPYEIKELLGAGGMGEVYRAHDSQLGRDVAIKLLPPAFTGDADRQARFDREAHLLAALNHPNIAAIYGIAAEGTTRALVLELVEGQTLFERLARGSMPVPDALGVARAIVDALETAHERGIVHRDLKPANIKVTPDGVVKVLDFGLAKLAEPEVASGETVTATPGVSVEGQVLGTPAYMSPEQARGKLVDKRTDIWAFGCVLYEMLTGRPAFEGDTASDVIARILEREPDLSRLPAGVSNETRRLIERCFVKDPRRRLRDIGDARPDLEGAAREPDATKPRRVSRAAAAAGAVLAAVAGATAAFLAARWSAGETATGSDVVLQQLTFGSGLTTNPAISTDGRLVAYASDRAGTGDLDIWIQQTDGGVPLRLTDDPANDDMPDFSPDGREIAFRSERDGGGVYLVPALGGAARLLVPQGRRPRFSPDGTRLAYWTGPFRGFGARVGATVHVVPLAGGAAERVGRELAAAHDPVWAPDGRSLLVLGARERASGSLDWYWVPLDGRPAVRTGAFGTYPLRDTTVFQGDGAPTDWTERGVLFAAGGDLWALPLSMADGGISAAPERITISPGTVTGPVADRGGTLAFAVKRTSRVIERVPVAGDTPPAPATRLYADNRDVALRASETADGVTIVFERYYTGYREIWMRNTRTGSEQMVVRTDSRRVTSATISPDGARIVYAAGANSPGEADGYVVETRGGVPRSVCASCTLWGFFSDNHRVLATWDREHVIGLIDTRDGRRVELVRDADGRLDRPHASPDDRWLAFRYDAGGGRVFVVPVTPGTPQPRERWMPIEEHTTTGRPCGWSLDSRTLYLLLDTDGFRCLWGQRVDARAAGLAGAVFPVRHFHVGQMDDGGPSTTLGNPFTADGFLYERTEITSDVWRLTGR